MKGMVFTEFLTFVEDNFGYETVDKIIEESHLSNNGAYTAIGTYDHGDMVKLVTALSQQLNTPIPDLLRTFGKHLFYRFKALFPHFFKENQSAFDFLSSVDNYIHIEVKKLYKDAELPKFEYEKPSPNILIMYYTSSRHFEDLAEGLIAGCIEQHHEKVSIKKEVVLANEPAKTKIKFTLTKEN
ncbi:MAG: heme NO-binding domain-containing protein [Gammaproteobacteria bacterium]|nr:heme NO-binding domain-containing protein [Gammaproteobacteria bacterium]